MNQELKKLLENYLQKRNYKAYNTVISKEIIRYYVSRIREYDKDYLYSNVIELLDIVEAKLSMKEIIIFRNFYLVQKEDETAEITAMKLTQSFKKIEQLKDSNNGIKRK